MVGQQGTILPLAPSPSQKGSSIPGSHLSAHQTDTHTSNVIHDSGIQLEPGSQRQITIPGASTPAGAPSSTSGMCRKNTHQARRWYDVCSSSRGIIGIMGLSHYLHTTSSFSMSGRPCLCRPKRPSCRRQPKRRRRPRRHVSLKALAL